MLNLDKHSFNCAGYDPDSYYLFKGRVQAARELLRQARQCLDGRTSASQRACQFISGALMRIDRIDFQD